MQHKNTNINPISIKLINAFPAYYDTIYANLVYYDILLFPTLKFKSALIKPNVAVFNDLHIIDIASLYINALINIPIKNPIINVDICLISSYFISPPHTATL